MRIVAIVINILFLIWVLAMGIYALTSEVVDQELLCGCVILSVPLALSTVALSRKNTVKPHQTRQD